MLWDFGVGVNFDDTHHDAVAPDQSSKNSREQLLFLYGFFTVKILVGNHEDFSMRTELASDGRLRHRTDDLFYVDI